MLARLLESKRLLEHDSGNTLPFSNMTNPLNASTGTAIFTFRVTACPFIASDELNYSHRQK